MLTRGRRKIDLPCRHTKSFPCRMHSPTVHPLILQSPELSRYWLPATEKSNVRPKYCQRLRHNLTYIQCTDHHSGIRVDNSIPVRCDSILGKQHFDRKIDRHTNLLVDRHKCIRFEDHQRNQVHNYIRSRHSLLDIEHFHHKDYGHKRQ